MTQDASQFGYCDWWQIIAEIDVYCPTALIRRRVRSRWSIDFRFHLNYRRMSSFRFRVADTFGALIGKRTTFATFSFFLSIWENPSRVFCCRYWSLSSLTQVFFRNKRFSRHLTSLQLPWFCCLFKHMPSLQLEMGLFRAPSKRQRQIVLFSDFHLGCLVVPLLFSREALNLRV